MDGRTHLTGKDIGAKLRAFVRRIALSRLFWVMLFCAVFRLCYYTLVQPFTNYPDTSTYLSASHLNFFIGQTDQVRTPVYPAFIQAVRFLSPGNYIIGITLIQGLINYLSIIVFYKALRLIFKNNFAITAASAVYGCLPGIINWNKCILTESLSISATALLIYILAVFIKKPGTAKAAALAFYSLFLVMLRPSFLYVLILMPVFFLLRLIFIKTERKICLTGLLSAFSCFALLAVYCAGIYKPSGVFTVSTVTVTNGTCNVVMSGSYKYGGDPDIIRIIDETGKRSYGYAAYMALSAKYSVKQLSDFNKTAVNNGLKDYINYSLGKFVKIGPGRASAVYAAFKDKDGYNIAQKAFYKAAYVFDFAALPLFFAGVYLLLLIELVFSVVSWAKYKSVPWFWIFLLLLAAGHIFVAVAGAQAEWPRLTAPALPFLTVMLYGYIDMLASRVKQIVSKRRAAAQGIPKTGY